MEVCGCSCAYAPFHITRREDAHDATHSTLFPFRTFHEPLIWQSTLVHHPSTSVHQLNSANHLLFSSRFHRFWTFASLCTSSSVCSHRHTMVPIAAMEFRSAVHERKTNQKKPDFDASTTAGLCMHYTTSETLTTVARHSHTPTHTHTNSHLHTHAT